MANENETTQAQVIWDIHVPTTAKCSERVFRSTSAVRGFHNYGSCSLKVTAVEGTRAVRSGRFGDVRPNEEVPDFRCSLHATAAQQAKAAKKQAEAEAAREARDRREKDRYARLRRVQAWANAIKHQAHPTDPQLVEVAADVLVLLDQMAFRNY